MSKAKHLFVEVLTMRAKERGIKIADIPSWVSILLFILGIIGIITLEGIFKYVSWGLLGLAILIEATFFLVILPNRIYQRTVPYYNLYLAQQATPYKFIFLEPYSVGINESWGIIGLQAKIRSWLFDDISINGVTLDMRFPLGGNKFRTVRFSTENLATIQLHGLLNYSAKDCWDYVSLVCRDRVENIPHYKGLRLEGQAKILVNVFPEIIIDIWGDVSFDRIKEL